MKQPDSIFEILKLSRKRTTVVSAKRLFFDGFNKWSHKCTIGGLAGLADGARAGAIISTVTIGHLQIGHMPISQPFSAHTYM